MEENPNYASALIYKKMVEVMKKTEAISKDRKNQQQGYAFRGIDDIYNSLHWVFAEVGLFMTTRILSYHREERTNKNGTVMFCTLMEFEFTFHAEDGSSVSTQAKGEAMDSGDKSTNKAMSAAQKYALLQTFLIPTKEDKDTETASPEVVKQKTTTPKSQSQPKAESPALANEKQINTLKAIMSASKFTDENRTAMAEKYDKLTADDAVKYIIKYGKQAIEHYLTDDSLVSEVERIQFESEIQEPTLQKVANVFKNLYDRVNALESLAHAEAQS